MPRKNSNTPRCEVCHTPMTKIVVDLEDNGTVMTAYECPEHQTLADAATETVEELRSQGFPVLSFIEEIAALPDGTPSIPLSHQIAVLGDLQPGKKVRVAMTDSDYIMVKVA